MNRTGYALLERSTSGPILREGGLVRANAKQSLAKRVHEIGAGVREILEEFQPEILSIEKVFSFGPNPKTALILAHARGAILFAAADADVPVVEYSPTQIKRLLVGNGRASKEQIQHAVRAELGLESIPEPNDVADATAVALCLYHSVRFAT